jgi:hypothetical protein
MKMGLRISAAVFAGFVCHSVLIFFWGDSGVVRLNELLAYKSRLSENITNLESINRELIAERDALLHDGVEISLRARALGYRKPGEIAVILPKRESRDSARTVGRYVRRIDPLARNQVLFRALAFAAGAAMFGATFILKKHGDNYSS